MTQLFRCSDEYIQGFTDGVSMVGSAQHIGLARGAVHEVGGDAAGEGLNPVLNAIEEAARLRADTYGSALAGGASGLKDFPIPGALAGLMFRLSSVFRGVRPDLRLALREPAEERIISLLERFVSPNDPIKSHEARACAMALALIIADAAEHRDTGSRCFAAFFNDESALASYHLLARAYEDFIFEFVLPRSDWNLETSSSLMRLFGAASAKEYLRSKSGGLQIKCIDPTRRLGALNSAIRELMDRVLEAGGAVVPEMREGWQSAIADVDDLFLDAGQLLYSLEHRFYRLSLLRSDRRFAEELGIFGLHSMETVDGCINSIVNLNFSRALALNIKLAADRMPPIAVSKEIRPDFIRLVNELVVLGIRSASMARGERWIGIRGSAGETGFCVEIGHNLAGASDAGAVGGDAGLAAWRSRMLSTARRIAQRRGWGLEFSDSTADGGQTVAVLDVKFTEVPDVHEKEEGDADSSDGMQSDDQLFAATELAAPALIDGATAMIRP